MSITDIVYETEKQYFYVIRARKGYEVYENAATHAVRVAVIGYPGDRGLQRAKYEADRREAARVSCA